MPRRPLFSAAERESLLAFPDTEDLLIRHYTLLPHLSPLGWEHITLTGGYIWQQSGQVKQGDFRSLRMPEPA